MKVFIILDQFSESEAARLILQQEREFRRRNFEVLIVTMKKEDEKNTLVKNLFYPEGDIECVPVSSTMDFSGIFSLVKFLKEEKPDIVMTHQKLGNTVGRMAALLARVPKIFTFENPAFLSSWSKTLQNFSDKIISTVDVDRDKLIRYGIEPGNIVYLRDSLDLDLYKRGSSQDPRRELGIEPGKFVFLFYGDLVIEKAVDVLLRAFTKIPEGLLIIMGDGPEKKNLQDLATKLLVNGRVLFYPPNKKVISMLLTSDCFVLPSRSEKYNKNLVEALATGVPAIVSDFPGHEEYVKNEKNGLVVPMQNSEKLAAAMERVMKDPVFFAELKKGTSNELLKYTIEVHTDKILELASDKKSVSRDLFQMFRFLFASFLFAGLQILLLFTLAELFFLPYMRMAGVSFVVVSVIAFNTQKFWVFKNPSLPHLALEIPLYILIALVNLAILIGLLYFTTGMIGVNYLFVASAAAAFAVIDTFSAYKKIFAP